MPYKLIIRNSKVVLKTIGNAFLSIFGIKDEAGTGSITNNIVDWTIQHRTQTTAQWNADTTTILLRGQLGIEDTGTTAFKLKVGNGIDLWSGLQYLSGGGSYVWGAITGTLSNQTDLQTALDSKVDENAAITGATKTKITYDSKGLVTAGADATTSDISEGTNLYYTNGRVDTRVAAYTGDVTLSGTTFAIGSGVIVNADINASAAIDATKIANGSVSNTEFQYLDGVTSNIQTQLNATFNNYYVCCLSTNPADSSNYYFGQNPFALALTSTGARKFKFHTAGTLNAFLFSILQTVNGSNETVTVRLRNETTATETLLGTFTSDFGGSTSGTFAFTGLSISVNTTDEYTLKIETPAWATNPTTWVLGGNLRVKP